MSVLGSLEPNNRNSFIKVCSFSVNHSFDMISSVIFPHRINIAFTTRPVTFSLYHATFSRRVESLFARSHFSTPSSRESRSRPSSNIFCNSVGSFIRESLSMLPISLDITLSIFPKDSSFQFVPGFFD